MSTHWLSVVEASRLLNRDPRSIRRYVDRYGITSRKLITTDRGVILQVDREALLDVAFKLGIETMEDASGNGDQVPALRDMLTLQKRLVRIEETVVKTHMMLFYACLFGLLLWIHPVAKGIYELLRP